jgi:hypothetical protein
MYYNPSMERLRNSPKNILTSKLNQMEWDRRRLQEKKNDFSNTKEINRIINSLKNIPQDTVYELSNYPNQGDSTPVTIHKFVDNNNIENNNLFIAFKLKEIINDQEILVDKKVAIGRFRFCQTAELITRDPEDRKNFRVEEEKLNYYLHLNTTKPDQSGS